MQAGSRVVRRASDPRPFVLFPVWTEEAVARLVMADVDVDVEGRMKSKLLEALQATHVVTVHLLWQ